MPRMAAHTFGWTGVPFCADVKRYLHGALGRRVGVNLAHLGGFRQRVVGLVGNLLGRSAAIPFSAELRRHLRDFEVYAFNALTVSGRGFNFICASNCPRYLVIWLWLMPASLINSPSYS